MHLTCCAAYLVSAGRGERRVVRNLEGFGAETTHLQDRIVSASPINLPRSWHKLNQLYRAFLINWCRLGQLPGRQSLSKNLSHPTFLRRTEQHCSSCPISYG